MSFARVYRGFAWRIWQAVQIATGLVSLMFLALVAAYCTGVRW